MSLTLSYIILLLVAIYAVYKLRALIQKDKNAIIPLLILIPKEKGETHLQHSQKDIQLTNELYKRLLEFKIWFAIEAVVESIGEEIKFFIFINRSNEHRVREIIQSLWTNSEAPEVDYYNLFSSMGDGQTKISYLAQAKPYLIPLTTNNDTFSRLLHCLSELNVIGESAAIQWIIKPAHSKIKYDISSQITQLQKNKVPDKQIHQDFHLTQESVRALEEKINQPLAAVNCRLAIHATNNKRAEQILKKITLVFEEPHSNTQFNQIELNSFKKPDLAIENFLRHKFMPEIEMILSTAEIAPLFHLPGQNTPNSKIQRRF